MRLESKYVPVSGSRLLMWAMVASLVALLTLRMTSAQQASSDPSQDSGAASSAPSFSEQELEDLVAPVALYPDELLAQVLPASASPLDVVKAAQYLEKNPGAKEAPPEGLSAWDPAVISLMAFPTVLKKMAEDLEWTETLGEAVSNQEEDVYAAIQQVRARAQAAGNLQTNDKQVIVREKETIKIVPADPQVIYVPTYNPTVIYTPPPYPTHPVLVFGPAVPVGFGWSYAFDWRHRHIVYHDHWYHPRHHRRHHYYHKKVVYKKNVNVNKTINVNRPGGPSNAWRPRRVGKGPGRAAKRPAVLSQSEYHRPGAGPGRTRGYGPGRAPVRPQGTPGGYKSGAEVRQNANRGKASRQKSARQAGPSRVSGPSALGGYSSQGETRALSNRGKASRGGSKGGGKRRGGGRRRR